MIFIKDDVVSRNEFLTVKDHVMSDDFPWFYTSSTASKIDNDPSFFHVALKHRGIPNSYAAPMFESLVKNICNSSDIIINELIRIRIGMYCNKNHEHIHMPHVDHLDDLYTGLFYFNDSDGDTIIYEEKYDKSFSLSPIDYYEKNLNKEIRKSIFITPKENRVVIFDSNYYHSSSSPIKTERRVVMSFNFN